MLHIVADVGNRHPEFESLAAALAVNRVVEVLCGFTVDRHQRQVAQIFASLEVFIGHPGWKLRSRFFDLRGKFVGQIMLSQRDLDFHSRIGVVAKHLDDAPDRLRVALRLLDDFGDHDLAGLCTAVCACRYQNVLADAAIFRRDDTDSVFVQEASDHFRIGALENFDDMPLAPATRIDAAFARDHTIAVQHLGHFARVQEQVLALAVTHQEAEPVRMALHPAFDQIEFVDHANRILAIAHDLTVALHRAQAALERLGLMRRDGKQLRHQVHRHRNALLQQDIENMFAAGQRMLVTRSLALEMRITPADIRAATTGNGFTAGGLGSFLCGFHSGNRFVDRRRRVDKAALSHYILRPSVPRWRNW